MKVHTNSDVQKINIEDKKAKSIKVNDEIIESDIILSGADYHHSEQLLDEKYRQYSESYWDKKVFAPSSLLFYLGFDKKIKNAEHHNLFFDVDFDAHADSIYSTKKWPTEPLFYANFTSKTDSDTAPEGCENGFFLVPIAPGLEDTNELREQYYDIVMDRFEKLTGEKIKDYVIYKKSYCVNDFVKDYNSYKGNAYGMANTLLQTAFLRPKLKSKKIDGLFFTGQLTVPGWSFSCINFWKISFSTHFKKPSIMKSIFDIVSKRCSKTVTQSYSTSFSTATRLLAPSIRQDIYNIYGFVRFADEIVDSFHDYDKETLFHDFKKQMYDAIENKNKLKPNTQCFSRNCS